MELQQLIEKWTKEMADIKSHIKQHEDTFGHPAVHSRERLEAISEMLADVKQLNLPPVRRSFNWLSNLMTTQCPRCELGRVSHDHSEPHGWTTIEVYKCNRCNTEFV